MAEKISSYRELRVYRGAMNATMEIFEMTKKFPSEEKYSLTDQIRRSSRSVCANMGEAWCKRRYKAAFIAKLAIRKLKHAKPRYGSKYLILANTVLKPSLKNWTKNMKV